MTERVNAVRALREANETLEQRVAEALAERRLMAELVQTTNTFVQVLDKDFRFLAINDANVAEYEKLYGFRPKVGDSLAELLAARPELREAALAVWPSVRFVMTKPFAISALIGKVWEIFGGRMIAVPGCSAVRAKGSAARAGLLPNPLTQNVHC